MKKNKNLKLLENLGIIVNIILTIILIMIILIKTNYIVSLYPKNYEIIIILIAGLIFYLTLYIQLIIHELGHLIFGLITNYKFSSFRIGNIILIKNKKKFKVKLLKITGTGGQCIMTPPDLINNKMPVILYNLGGVLLNIITALIFIGLHIINYNNIILAYIFDILAIFGFYFGALNGIPMKMGIIDNDGLNTISLVKDSNAQKALWTQLKINENLSNNKRLKDMHQEWFELDKNANLNNSIIATIAVYQCNKLMDEHNFKKAKKQISDLLKKETAILGIHQNLLICDHIYCELIEGNINKAKQLYTSSLKKFMVSMNDFPTIIRTNYAISLLLEKNHSKANSYLKQFIKRCKTYPYSSDMIAERELISIATAITKQ